MPPKEVLKKRRRKWHMIVASPEFRNKEIGETTTTESENLVGRTLTLNLMNITNDPKTQNSKVTFKIIKVDKDRAITEFKSYNLLQTAVRRLAQKDKEKVSDSFSVKTKDGISVRLKPMFVTKSTTKQSVLSALRKECKKFLESYASKNTYSNMVMDVVGFRIQIGLKNQLKKIYPITVCQIRTFSKE